MLDRKSNKLNPLTVLVMGALAVAAQSNLAQADDAPATKLEKIEVTGSSIKRTVDDETAMPIQIITREDISRSGVQNTEDLLRTISATSTSGATQMSSGSGATTSGVSTVSLRALGSHRTLVLINGRRSTVFGGVPGSDGDGAVDISSIPVSAIERIEVLKDGASAIYGSDAIAGVVNFILRKNLTGGEASLTYGDTLNGGAHVSKFNGVTGFGDMLNDGYNVMFGINAQKEGVLYGRDRSFANTSILQDSLGGINDTASSNTYPANVLTPGLSSRNPLQGNCAPSVTDPNYSSLRCMFDPGSYVALIPQTERLSLFSNFNKRVGDDASLYTELAYTRNKTDYTIQPAPISYVFSVSPNNPYTAFLNNYLTANPGIATAYGANAASFQPTSILTPLAIFIPTNSPYYNQALGAFNAATQAVFTGANSPIAAKFRSFANGLRSLEDISESSRIAAGFKGLAADWDYDFGALYARSKVTESPTNGYFSQSGLAELFDSGVVNPFGPQTAAVQSQINALGFNGEAFHSITSQAELNAKASREIFTLPAGAASLAVGASVRRESYELASAAAIQSGDISGYGGNFLPVSKSRNVEAAFSEVEVPITKQLTGDLAVRWENYENVGTTTTPKLGFRWQPQKNLLFRTSYGRGFRAPSLSDLYAPVTAGVSPVLGNLDPVRCNFNPNLPECSGGQVAVLNGGNPNLKPEKSENFTLGVVWEPTANSSVSLDYYKIRLRDTITTGGIGAATILSTAAFENQYSQYVVRNPSTAAGDPGSIQYINQTNQNLFNTLTDGVDLDMRWRFAANESGRWTAGLNGTYVHSYQAQQPDGTYLSYVDNVGNAGSLISRWRYRANLNWDTATWNTTVAYNFQLGYRDTPAGFSAATDANGNAIAPMVPAVRTTDVQTSYIGIPNWVLTVGARNLFNDFPPYTNVPGTGPFQSGYDPSYGDPRGRFMYGTVTYKWK